MFSALSVTSGDVNTQAVGRFASGLKFLYLRPSHNVQPVFPVYVVILGRIANLPASKGKLDKCINRGAKRNLPYILSGRDEISRLRLFDRNKG